MIICWNNCPETFEQNCFTCILYLFIYLSINTYTLNRMYVLKQVIHSCSYVVETINTRTTDS